MEVRGIDVSHWQGAIDWAKVKASGIQFAIIKSGGSDAGFYTDPRWEENYRNAKANGIAVGAYYFVGLRNRWPFLLKIMWQALKNVWLGVCCDGFLL